MLFTWGDTVRVKAGAPSWARPDAVAEVVGVRTLDNDALVQKFGAPLGTPLYVIEFGDGESVEVPESLLESSLLK